jgi:hypothetical protein
MLTARGILTLLLTTVLLPAPRTEQYHWIHILQYRPMVSSLESSEGSSLFEVLLHNPEHQPSQKRAWRMGSFNTAEVPTVPVSNSGASNPSGVCPRAVPS